MAEEKILEKVGEKEKEKTLWDMFLEYMEANKEKEEMQKKRLIETL